DGKRVMAFEQSSRGVLASRSNRGKSDHKSPWMWIGVLVVWIVFMGPLQWPLLHLAFGSPASWFYRLLVVYVVCWLNFALLCAVRQLALIFLSSVRRPASRCLGGCLTDTPTVAVLYTTMNDFSHAAALSCVRQTHPRSHVFLLDDSTDLALRAM